MSIKSPWISEIPNEVDRTKGYCAGMTDALRRLRTGRRGPATDDDRPPPSLFPHSTRRMLQAIDGYWLHCDGLPKGRFPRSRSTAEDWWARFEKYRAQVEEQLGATAKATWSPRR